jgi:hypothetical protein
MEAPLHERDALCCGTSVHAMRLRARVCHAAAWPYCVGMLQKSVDVGTGHHLVTRQPEPAVAFRHDRHVASRSESDASVPFHVPFKGHRTTERQVELRTRQTKSGITAYRFHVFSRERMREPCTRDPQYRVSNRSGTLTVSCLAYSTVTQEELRRPETRADRRETRACACVPSFYKGT